MRTDWSLCRTYSSLANGSFNVTESAVTNLENIMVFDDPEIAMTFFEEFKRLHRVSQPLKIKG
jgi:phosphatidylserine/phosphatidylglycerophosphate/cardiolipin synthase-like enzyme